MNMRPSITELDWKPRSSDWTPHNFHERRKQRQKAYKRVAQRNATESSGQISSISNQRCTEPSSLPTYSSEFAKNALKAQREKIIADELHEISSRSVEDCNANLAVKKRNLISSIRIDVALKYRVNPSDLNKPHSKSFLCLAKFEAFYRSKIETGKSLSVIGREFGGRNHATVFDGIERYREYQKGNFPKNLKPYENLILPADYLDEEGSE
jgi:hypothetical protein